MPRFRILENTLAGSTRYILVLPMMAYGEDHLPMLGSIALNGDETWWALTQDDVNVQLDAMLCHSFTNVTVKTIEE